MLTTLALTLLGPAPGPAAPDVQDLDLLPDGSLLVVTTESVALRLDAATGEELGPFDALSEPVDQVWLGPVSGALAWLAPGRRLHLRTSLDSEPISFEYPSPTEDPEAWVRLALEWSHDATHVVTSGDAFFLADPVAPPRIWTAAGDLVWTGPPAREVDVHPRRNELCAVFADGLAVGWPAEGPDPRLARIELDGVVLTAQYAPDGRSIAVGGRRVGEDGRGTALLWVLDAESREVRYEREVRGVDPMGLKDWLQCVRWSPDGAHLGISLGKGFAPGILRASDGELVWSGGFRGGRMWELFDVSWTGAGQLVCWWPKTSIVGPGAEGAALELDGTLAPRLLVGLPGGDEIVFRTDTSPRQLVRIDPRTGDERWSVRAPVAR